MIWEELMRAAEHYRFTKYGFVRGLSMDDVKFLFTKNIPAIVKKSSLMR